MVHGMSWESRAGRAGGRWDVEFGEEPGRRSARRLVEDREAEAGIDAPFCITLGNVSDAVAEEAERHGADPLVIGRGVMQNTMGRSANALTGLDHSPGALVRCLAFEPGLPLAGSPASASGA